MTDPEPQQPTDNPEPNIIEQGCGSLWPWLKWKWRQIFGKKKET
jgi:hypothetical protein